VSKILRKKYEYLCSADDRKQSPIKHTNGMQPDIEKALAIWVRKRQRTGVATSDEELLQQARHFVFYTEHGDYSHLKAFDSTWISKFRLENDFSSNSSMAGRSTSDQVASGLSSTPVVSKTLSPTQEDARRAIHTLCQIRLLNQEEIAFLKRLMA
jgi:hypothetical protein